jgi:hypothetical protein
MKPLLPALLVSFAGVAPAIAQEDPATRPPAPEPLVEESPQSAAAERPPLGWLSDPNEAPNDFLDALVSGKIHLDNRFRIELADTTDRRSSTAITNRIRLGYESKPFYGFSGFIEMENVATPSVNDYWVPATGDGDPDRTVIADPPGTEVNQAWGRFDVHSLGDTGISFDLKAGRQRIKLDDDRFIGNVGWRQFEQTYDSASVRSDLGVEGLSLFYAYVWNVQRIFGPDGPNPDSDSHLINLSYRVAPELEVIPFAYLLDFENDDPLNSSDSFGVRLTGDLWKDADDEADLFADYELTYAHQSDAGSNPVDYDADFFAAQFRVTRKQLGHVVAGYQLLGSDDGNFAFRFPLGTNHKFQGFADNFLVTPAVGLQDLYLGIGADLPWGIKGAMIYHKFWSDEGGNDLGDELDFVASKQITPNWSVLLKGAFFDGDSGQPDTTRFWVQTTIRF